MKAKGDKQGGPPPCLKIMSSLKAAFEWMRALPLIKLGFTGTQDGMDLDQVTALAGIFLSLLKLKVPLELHHGCCVGADEQAHKILKGMAQRHDRLKDVVIIGYPSNIKDKQSEVMSDCDLLYAEHDPLVRNKMIVNDIEYLIAAPKQVQETTRSGTWSTVRYARRVALKRGLEIKLLPRNERTNQK